MKKLITICLLFVGLVANALDLNIDDVKFYYGHQSKKCVAYTFSEKKFIIDEYRAGEFLIEEKYSNDAGGITFLLFEHDGVERRIVVTSNFGACRFYEDLIVNNKNVKAYQYAGLTSYKDSPKPLDLTDKK